MQKGPSEPKKDDREPSDSKASDPIPIASSRSISPTGSRPIPITGSRAISMSGSPAASVDLASLRDSIPGSDPIPIPGSSCPLLFSHGHREMTVGSAPQQHFEFVVGSPPGVHADRRGRGRFYSSSDSVLPFAQDSSSDEENNKSDKKPKPFDQ